MFSKASAVMSSGLRGASGSWPREVVARGKPKPKPNVAKMIFGKSKIVRPTRVAAAFAMGCVFRQRVLTKGDETPFRRCCKAAAKRGKYQEVFVFSLSGHPTSGTSGGLARPRPAIA